VIVIHLGIVLAIGLFGGRARRRRRELAREAHRAARELHRQAHAAKDARRQQRSDARRGPGQRQLVQPRKPVAAERVAGGGVWNQRQAGDSRVRHGFE